MVERSIFVTPSTVAYLNGYNAAINDDSRRKGLSSVNVTELTFLTFIQDGANHLELHSALEKMDPVYKADISNSQFLKKHISFYEGPEWVESFLLAKGYLHHIKKTNPKLKENSALQTFIVDFFTSIRRKKSFVFAEDFSELCKEARELSAEHRIVIENLLGAFQTTKDQTIVPRKEVLLEQARVFEEIIEEKLFKQYVEACNGFEDVNVRMSDLIKRILVLRRKICKKHDKLMKLRDQTLRILPLSGKLLDIVFGNIPSKTAEVIESWLNKAEGRIVMYSASDFLKYALQRRTHSVGVKDASNSGDMPINSD